MRNGACYPQPPLVPRTFVNDCGLWPTPDVPNGGRALPQGTTRTGQTPDGRKKQVGLEQAVRRWPTPHGFSPDGRSNGPSGNELGRAVNRALWPTATAGDAKASGSRNTRTSRAHGGESLTDAVRQDGGTGRRWPTPTASDSDRGSRTYPRGNRTLWGAVYPTPTVQDAENNAGPSQANRNSPPLNAVVGGALNPRWVEWLMGWPVGWTALEPLGMAGFREWLKAHGSS
jgi:hypothetical protein